MPTSPSIIKPSIGPEGIELLSPSNSFNPLTLIFPLQGKFDIVGRREKREGVAVVVVVVVGGGGEGGGLVGREGGTVPLLDRPEGEHSKLFLCGV